MASSMVATMVAAAAMLLLAVASPSRAAAGGELGSLDITNLGARGDGKTDSTKALLQAWSHACAAAGTKKIVIPKGDFLTGGLELTGPCTSSIIIRLDGNLIGTGDLSAYKKNWIQIMHVENLVINGHGTIDGQGPLVWQQNECAKNYNCKILPNSLVLDFVTNAQIRGVKLLNSKFFHMNLYECRNVVVEKVNITAPGDSPNTDGIHIGDSTNITIRATTIATGDDCISVGPGCRTIRVHGVRCGPGHGISVGSLGRYKDEKDVEDVSVTDCTMVGTKNGLRIKSYEDSKSPIKASKFVYDGITMHNVSHPIIIDQKYCPHSICTQSGDSKVAVSDIVFKNIRGTSATLNCANNLPCQGVQLISVDVKYNKPDNKTMAVCRNAVGKTGGVAKELACL